MADDALVRTCKLRPVMGEDVFMRLYREEVAWALLQRPAEQLTDRDMVPFKEVHVGRRVYVAQLDSPINWHVAANIRLDGMVDSLQFNNVLRVRDGAPKPNPVAENVMEIRMHNGDVVSVTNISATLYTQDGSLLNQQPIKTMLGTKNFKLFTSSGILKAEGTTVALWKFLIILSTQNILYLDERDKTALVANQPIRVYLNSENYAEVYQEFGSFFVTYTADEINLVNLKKALGTILYMVQVIADIDDLPAAAVTFPRPKSGKTKSLKDIYPPGMPTGCEDLVRVLENNEHFFYDNDRKVSFNGQHFACINEDLYPVIRNQLGNKFGFMPCCESLPPKKGYNTMMMKDLSEKFLSEVKKKDETRKLNFLENNFNFVVKSYANLDSFWQACLIGANRVVNREEAAETIFWACMAQEMPQDSDNTRKETFIAKDGYFDYKKCIHACECYFNVNIYMGVVSAKNVFVTLLSPREGMYVKQHNPNIDTWLIIQRKSVV